MRTASALLFAIAAGSHVAGVWDAIWTGVLIGVGILCLCAAIDHIVRDALVAKDDPYGVKPKGVGATIAGSAINSAQRRRYARFNGEDARD